MGLKSVKTAKETKNLLEQLMETYPISKLLYIALHKVIEDVKNGINSIHTQSFQYPRMQHRVEGFSEINPSHR